jgi:hypothetical protein
MALGWYRALLRLYPAWFRRRFGREIAALAALAYRRGERSQTALLLDLLGGAARERMRAASPQLVIALILLPLVLRVPPARLVAPDVRAEPATLPVAPGEVRARATPRPRKRRAQAAVPAPSVAPAAAPMRPPADLAPLLWASLTLPWQPGSAHTKAASPPVATSPPVSLRRPPRLRDRLPAIVEPDAVPGWMQTDGMVELSLQVAADGRVRSVEVLTPLGNGRDAFAQRLARRLVFVPACGDDGRPVASQVRFAIRFTTRAGGRRGLGAG